MRYAQVIVMLIFHNLLAPALRAEPLVVPGDPTPYAMYSDSKALIIGNKNYQNVDTWPKLSAVDKEVGDVAEALTKQGFSVEIKSDLDSEALPKQIRNFLLRKVDRNTRLLVYYAGHGYSNPGGGDGYIVPVDGLASNDGDFIAGLLNFADIVNWSRRSPAKHVFLVFDSCFSGALFAVRRNLAPSVSTLILSDIDRPGSQYMTSGSENESVPDGTTFADAFIQGIEGQADRNHDGIVTASELGPYIRDAIIPLRLQTPQYGSDIMPDRKLGDMVFLTGRAPQQIALQVAEINGPRIAAVRSIGLPAKSEASEFVNLEVRYFQKTSDEGKVTAALENNSIPYIVSKSLLPNTIPVNALACGPGVPAEAIKKLALSLLDQNVPLKQIYTFRRPDEKPKRIELVSVSDDAAGTVPLSGSVLTRAQIEQLSGCPKVLAGN